MSPVFMLSFRALLLRIFGRLRRRLRVLRSCSSDRRLVTTDASRERVCEVHEAVIGWSISLIYSGVIIR